jgi:hypothetical protein
MPSIEMAYERLKCEMQKGNRSERVHIVFVEREQAERIKNNKRKTRFVLCCDDPDQCARFEAQKDRIFRRIKNKAMMITLMERAWAEALSDHELDKIMAELEGPPE